MAWLGKPVPWIVYFASGILLLSSQADQASAEFKFLSSPLPFNVVGFDTNFKFDCTTNDPNATTSLHHRVSQDKPWRQLLPKVNELVQSGPVYTVMAFGTDDIGLYQCRARNDSGDTIQWPDGTGTAKVVGITVVPPKVDIEPVYAVVLTAGQSSNLTCSSVHGSTILWLDEHNNSPVPIVKTYAKSDRSQNYNILILMITNSQKSDSGTYKCLVTFQGKQNSKSRQVTVYETMVPTIPSSSGHPVVVLASNQTTLYCLAYGHPRPTVSWYKDGKHINVPGCTINPNLNPTCKNKKYMLKIKAITKHTEIKGSLTIFNSIYPDDQGNYTCRVVNAQGRIDATIFVNVQAQPAIVKKLEFFHQSKLPAQVYCTIKTSNPAASFEWEYQSCLAGQVDCPLPDSWSRLPDSHSVQPAFGVKTNRSQVQIPKNQEAAFYRCTASNKLGKEHLVLTFFRVDKGSDVIKIKSPSNPLVSITEEPFHIDCVARQDDVQWLKGGKTLSTKSDPRVNITAIPLDQMYTKIVLTVMNATARDSGVYTCEATFLRPQLVNDSILVIVKDRVKPNITGLVSQEVREQIPGYVELLCETRTANPKAKIKWYEKEEGKWINLARKISGGLSSSRDCTTRKPGFYVLNKDKSHLVICNPTHSKHTGWYQCTAENSEGRDEKQATLDILAQSRIINEKFQEIPVALGTTINETCSATGNPLPDVVWTRTNDPNGKVLSRGKGSALLVVKDVQGKDLGNYTCNATNTIKSVIAVFTIKESNGGIDLPVKGLSTEVLVGIICGCVAFVLIVVIICLVLYRRQKKQIEEYKELYFLRTGSSDYKIDPDRSLLEQCSNLSYDLDWEFPEERLILGKILGSGAFGQVLKAQAIGMPAFKPRDKTPEELRRRSKIRRSMRESKKKNEYSSMRTAKQTVAVKCLKEGASESDYKDLASELKILIHLGEHKNIVNVLGACTRGRRLMVIIEYAPHGDLLSFLRGKRDIYDPVWEKNSNNPEKEFTLVDLGVAAYQISRGMEFLASRKCVHRDVAARNVLVGINYVMKISDFGLARDIYQYDLYVKTTTGLLPVKWMAMESLFDRVYTIKSDVWSFGVMLWELFALGNTPYPGLPTEQLLDFLSEGSRMNQPKNCPLELYAIMRDCWIEAPEQRPHFVAIAERLGKILEKNLTKDNPYVQLEVDKDSGTTDYYVNPCDSNMSRKTVDGYEEALPTPRPQSTLSYNSPLPSLPPNGPQSPDHEMPNSPLPSIPLQYRSGSESSNESGIDIGEKNKDLKEAEQKEPLILRLDEEPTSNGRKGKKRLSNIESAV